MWQYSLQISSKSEMVVREASGDLKWNDPRVKLEDLWSLLEISLHKVQTQNLLLTFTWNVKKAQNNFVPIFNLKVRVRLIHKCDLYSSKYGISNDIVKNCIRVFTC